MTNWHQILSFGFLHFGGAVLFFSVCNALAREASPLLLRLYGSPAVMILIWVSMRSEVKWSELDLWWVCKFASAVVIRFPWRLWDKGRNKEICRGWGQRIKDLNLLTKENSHCFPDAPFYENKGPLGPVLALSTRDSSSDIQRKSRTRWAHLRMQKCSTCSFPYLHILKSKITQL